MKQYTFTPLTMGKLMDGADITNIISDIHAKLIELVQIQPYINVTVFLWVIHNCLVDTVNGLSFMMLQPYECQGVTRNIYF